MLITLTYMTLWVLTAASGVGMLLARRAHHAALCLMGAMFGIAGHFLMLGQEFVAAIQIIVYVGAILAFFLFVIMLLNLRRSEPFALDRMSPAQKLGAGSAALLASLIVLGGALGGGEAVTPLFEGEGVAPFEQGAYRTVASDLITRWVYPFEAISLLLLAAMIAGIRVARTRPFINITMDADAADRPYAGPPRPGAAPPDAHPPAEGGATDDAHESQMAGSHHH